MIGGAGTCWVAVCLFWRLLSWCRAANSWGTVHNILFLVCSSRARECEVSNFSELGMDTFHRLHGVIFDELERQKSMAVDAVALTRAVMAGLEKGEKRRVQEAFNPRCVNGACEG